MRWLEKFQRQSPARPVDTRFVAQEPPRLVPQAPRAGKTGIAKTVQPSEVRQPLVPKIREIQEGELSCTLVTEDRWLIEQVAGIALGAAVRINHCSSVDQLDQVQVNGPVLWGVDALTQVGGTRNDPCDVLLGNAVDSEQLWLMASTKPRTRVAVLPHASGWLGEYLGQWALRSGRGHTLVLSGLAGGIGTSTLSSLLAHAGTLSGLNALLVDLDPFSSSLWPMLHWQTASGIGWEQLQTSGGILAAHQFREALARTQETAVLTWQQEPCRFEVDESLMVRVLAAARQAFDLVVIDTGRYIHPLNHVLTQFTDQQIITCHPEQIPRATELGHQFIACATWQRVSQLAQINNQLLGCFPPNERIARSAERSELLEALRSKALRRRIADYDLLPGTGVAKS